jgi:hypothetical protein
MNTWQKLTDGSWAICCDYQMEPGTVVQVQKRSGATSDETIGEHVYSLGARHVYHCATVRQKPAAVQVGDMTGACRLFDTATRSRLRHPAIVLHIAGLGQVRLNLAGAKARVPGSINVATPDGSAWFGRITREGAFEPSAKQPVPAGLTDALVAFAAEPAKMAAEHGRRTGLCCFCDLRLNDPTSTAIGYGRACA